MSSPSPSVARTWSKGELAGEPATLMAKYSTAENVGWNSLMSVTMKVTFVDADMGGTPWSMIFTTTVYVVGGVWRESGRNTWVKIFSYLVFSELDKGNKFTKYT